jgi:N-acetylmuramoyl-L-alanine amidase
MRRLGAETKRLILSTREKRAAYVLLLASFLAFPKISFPAVSPARRARAITTFERAARMRTTLEAQPENQRSKADYERVIQTFREVEHLNPAYSKAPAALAAVAELYEEMGRVYSADRYYLTAIKTYEFLISNYPENRVARDALFTVGEIYRTDLENPQEARRVFQQFLEKHPQSEKAPEAREKLKQLDELLAERVSGRAAPPPSPKEQRLAGPPEVTAVRRWVGPNYSRIVIGMEAEVKFETLRLANPDRIVLDIQNTRLSPALMGKTFPIEDGFLRQIRVAQFTPTVTRVVLDVQKIEDYSVIPLPNPFRLVVDIHGTPAQLVAKAVPPGPEKPAPDRPRANLPAPNPPPGSSTAKREAGLPPPQPALNPLPGTEGPEGKLAKRKSAPQGGAQGEPATVPQGGTSEISKAQAEPGIAPKPVPEPTDVVETARPAPSGTPRETEASANRTEGASGAGSANAPKPATPTEAGSRTLTRALGLKIGRIVIDPGHGGHDTGTIGPTGLQEKDVVLDVGLRLKKLLERNTGWTVIMTRSDDTFIPLEERTGIANEKAADLFISIHTNASRDKSARGIETYYLNFTSNPDALEVAARENATSQESVHQLQDLIKKIAMTEKIEESQEFARQVQREVHERVAKASGAPQRDRGTKKAPFVVLIGANMPSVLSEISFLTNPRDERLLRRGDYRQRVAEALYRGVLDYVKNLGGVTAVQRAASSETSSATRPDF